MYKTKEKKSVSLYRNFSPKTKNCQRTEMQFHIAHLVGHDLSEEMGSIVKSISAAVAHSFSMKGE